MAVHAPGVRINVDLGDLIVILAIITAHKLLDLSALRSVPPSDTSASSHHGLGVICSIEGGLVLMERLGFAQIALSSGIHLALRGSEIGTDRR